MAVVPFPVGTADNIFDQFWGLGYKSLVPVIPPNAAISPNSSLYNRRGTAQDARGKVPGVRGRSGDWFSWNWTQHDTQEDDLARWHAMGANIGIRTGDGLYAIDADTMDEDSARIIRDIVEDVLGKGCAVRIGRYPKALYPVRLTEDISYLMLPFGPLGEQGKPTERCEVLGARKFFAAHGLHPKTNKPYSWPRGVPAYDALPLITPDQLNAIMERMKAALPNAGAFHSEGSDTEVNQETLRGDAATVRKAVEAIPNTSAHFSTRESYRDMGYAIKAAVEDEHEALEIFQEWCERWADGRNDPEIVEADWRRMKPPYRIGAPYIYRMAEATSDGAFSTAEVHFAPVEEKPLDPFDTQMANEREIEKAETPDTYELLTFSDLKARPAPTFLIDGFIPDVSVGFLYSAPGVGKSFLALDIGLTIAASLPDWHGVTTTHDPEASVLYIASEGSFDLKNRIEAWLSARGLENLPNRFYIIEQTIDFMQTADIDRLLRTVARAGIRPALVVVDTVSRAMPGADENLQKEMTLFVKACDRVRDAYRCAVMGVHHAGKSGDMRGSTVLRGAGDFVIRLERKPGATVASLTMEKQKAAPDGWDASVMLNKIGLGEGQSSLVASLVEGPDGLGTRHTEPGEGITARVLKDMAEAWDAGEPWGATYHTKDRYAVRIMSRDYGLKAADAEAMLKTWEGAGVIEVKKRSAKDHKRGYAVLQHFTGGEGATGEGGFGEHFSPVYASKDEAPDTAFG